MTALHERLVAPDASPGGHRRHDHDRHQYEHACEDLEDVAAWAFIRLTETELIP